MEKNIQEEILTLSPLEHVRLRPGVYAGDTSNTNQLVIEVFANALDCYNAGYGNIIRLEIKDNGTIICEDHGQGFAINELREDGTTTLEAAFSVMNTSGKFSEDGLYEGTSLGMNGMGSKICTFLSEYLCVQSYRNHQREKILFTNGVFTKREILYEEDDGSGTIVTFKPSAQFFTVPKPDIQFITNFLTDISCLCPGLTIQFNNQIIKNNGINDLLTRKVNNAIEIINRRLIFDKKTENQELNLGLTFTTNSNTTLIPYVNCGATDTGPHITAIKSTITRVLNTWGRKNNYLTDKDKNLDGSSIQEGMVMVCNITTTSAAYNAQVKTTITKIDTSFISSTLGQELEIWLDNNPNDGKNIIEKALLARKAAEAAKKARAAVKAKADTKTKLKIVAMPSKLADCHSKDRNKCELYLTEGDSASGGAKIIRDASYQAILGLRGKVLNCLTADTAKIHKNAEVMDIIRALGLEWTADGKKVIYDSKKLRYGKLIIAADKDPDGDHIQTLILTMLWTLIPDIILDGYVYIAIPPLYKAEWGTQYEYLNDKQVLEQFKQTHKKFTLSYYKGLGEANPQELGQMILNPETRNIQQVKVEDIGLTNITFNNLMGADSAPKKRFIFNNAVEAM